MKIGVIWYMMLYNSIAPSLKHRTHIEAIIELGRPCKHRIHTKYRDIYAYLYDIQKPRYKFCYILKHLLFKATVLGR